MFQSLFQQDAVEEIISVRQVEGEPEAFDDHVDASSSAKKKNVEYLVKWKNLDAKYNSWVDSSRINPKILDDYNKLQWNKKKEKIDKVLSQKVPFSPSIEEYECCENCNSRILFSAAIHNNRDRVIRILAKNHSFVSCLLLERLLLHSISLTSSHFRLNGTKRMLSLLQSNTITWRWQRFFLFILFLLHN